MARLIFFLMLIAWGTMDALPTPKYLYKILSYRNWQSTLGTKVVVLSGNDDEFIHFSTEAQVDRIIEKYWGDASQYVMLKIDAQKLQGELKYEANSSGVNKYYHLYEGFIPIQAILEAKIVFREPLLSLHQNKLDLVQAGDRYSGKKLVRFRRKRSSVLKFRGSSEIW